MNQAQNSAPLIEHTPELDACELREDVRELVFSGVSKSKIIDCLLKDHNDRRGDSQYWGEFLFPLASKIIEQATADAIKAGVIIDGFSGYELAPASELANQITPGAWAIKGILPAQGVGAVYGASASAKGFFLLDLVAAVAAGEPWQGHRTKQLPVVIVNLEGAAGYPKRLKAYELKHGPIKGELYILNGAPFLLTDDAQIEALAAAIIAKGAAGGIVFIDTLSQAGGGVEENTSEGMGSIVAGAMKLQRLVGGMVILVHHIGKDASKGMRGHTSLFASLDCAIEISRDGDQRSWRVAKSKDGEDGIGGQFRLEIVEVGIDEDGDPITSCVVHHLESAFDGVFAAKVPKGGNQRIVYDRLNRLLDESIELGRGGAAATTPCIGMEAAVLACKDCLTTDPKRRGERTRTAIAGLVNAGLFRLEGGWLWQTRPRART